MEILPNTVGAEFLEEAGSRREILKLLSVTTGVRRARYVKGQPMAQDLVPAFTKKQRAGPWQARLIIVCP